MKDVLIGLLDGIGSLGAIRMFLGAGIGAVLGGLAFYFSPNVAAALKKSDEKPRVSVQQGGAGNVQNNYFGDSETEAGRLVSQAQFAKVADIEKFFGSKDESGLRVLFDIPLILVKNIETQVIRIRYIEAGKEQDFFYNSHTDNGQWIMWAKEGHFSTGLTGVHLNTGPKDVHHLVTTTKYQLATQKLTEFSNSALVPDLIKVEINSFSSLLARDMQLMMVIMDQRMHEDVNYFLRHLDMKSQYYGVIQNDFAVRIEPLKPSADRILAAIAAAWKISGK